MGRPPLSRGEATDVPSRGDHVHVALSMFRRRGSQRLHKVPNVSVFSARSRRARSGRRHSTTLWVTRAADVGNRALCSRSASIRCDQMRPCGRTVPLPGLTRILTSPLRSSLGGIVCGCHRFDAPPERDVPNAVATLLGFPVGVGLAGHSSDPRPRLAWAFASNELALGLCAFGHRELYTTRDGTSA